MKSRSPTRCATLRAMAPRGGCVPPAKRQQKGPLLHVEEVGASGVRSAFAKSRTRGRGDADRAAAQRGLTRGVYLICWA